MNEMKIIQPENLDQASDLTQLEFQTPNKTKKDVAEFLGVTVRTVENMMNSSSLPYYRLGSRRVRFRLIEVLEWLEERFKAPG